MDMKLDTDKLKQLRESKAWSQTHLAQVSGISLRTIQRIEKSGIASHESVKSLCATYNIEVDSLSANEPPESNVTGRSSLNFKVTKIAVKATALSFVVAFAIAYFLTR